MKTFSNYLILAAALVQLTACQTTGSDQQAADMAKQQQSAKIDAAIDKALAEGGEANLSGALLALERQYKRDSSNPDTAYRYAKALRQADFANRASVVLTPFAKQPEAPSGILSEMSSIELSLGHFKSAENYAQQAVMKNPEDYIAYQNLGIALESQENHPAAERAFRKGLETWKGDPTPIMNNLALNLATQGYIDEAIQILEKAKALSPDRIEIERNLRIVRALGETS
ncbi:MAG: tetratricopeptide repeat protein [Rhodospirillales bacterium]|nr:tetratricopeptide repeat protein [Alphaproteobacteria bacterium]MCB9977639.1 tetratricopeptide repeat protein [Rhodospirillales bacterium]